MAKLGPHPMIADRIAVDFRPCSTSDASRTEIQTQESLKPSDVVFKPAEQLLQKDLQGQSW